MRFLKYNILCVAMTLFFSGCDDFLGDNIDPNKSSLDQLSPAELLPTSIYFTSQAHYSIAFGMCQYSQQIASYFNPGNDTQGRNSTFRRMEYHLSGIVCGFEIVNYACGT